MAGRRLTAGEAVREFEIAVAALRDALLLPFAALIAGLLWLLSQLARRWPGLPKE